MLKLECQVLIVGGGPAGLSVASHLEDKISSIIVHQDYEVGKPVRTSGGTWVRDMRELAIPEDLYQIIDQLDFYSDNAKACFEVEYDKMAVLDITKLYQYLAQLSERKNRTLLLGTKFKGCKLLDDGRYISTAYSRSKGDLHIVSDYIIDASGWQRSVLKSLGLGKKPDRKGVGIEYEFPIKDFNPHRAVLFVGSTALTGYGWIFPTPNGKLRLGIGVIHPDIDVNPRKVMDAFIESGCADRYGIDIPSDYEVNAGIIPSEAYEKKLLYGHVIRTGDAANFATPTAGEGIRMSIQFGRLLGLALSQKMNGDNQALLRYQKACTKEFYWDYKIGFMINKRIAKYSPQQWDKSVKRLSRLTEREVTQLLRCRVHWKTMARTIWLSLRAKICG